MTSIARWRVTWAGFSGAPGVSTFYTLAASATDPVPSIGAFFNAIKNIFPAAVSFSFPTVGDTLEDTTGALTGSKASAGYATPISPTGSGAWAAPAGISVVWDTGSVADGRRIKGRTYLVPVAGNCLDSNGTMDNTLRTTVQTAGAGLVAALGGSLVVWHRPRKATGTKPAHIGSSLPVLNAVVADKIVVLTSRRD